MESLDVILIAAVEAHTRAGHPADHPGRLAGVSHFLHSPKFLKKLKSEE
jgi:hypothetical protein